MAIDGVRKFDAREFVAVRVNGRETSSLKVFSPPPDIEIYGPDKHVKVTYDT
jgi:hypothetical protein